MAALTGKVAIVTGASSGIGRASAKLLAREGAGVVLAARRADALDAVAKEITAEGGEAVALAGDVADEAYAEALVALAMERFGGLDVGFNNAGVLGELAPAHELSRRGFAQTMETNVIGAFLGAKHQARVMRERRRGSIIFTSSFVGSTAAFPGMAAYAASKAALVGLMQAFAVELGPVGIRVNALLPGGTDTPAGRSFADTPEAVAFVERIHALKRRAAPDEIAQAALHLASDASSFMTGAALLVDGGVSINRS
jgi:NAD(P)-dependent dehydrogenase (short-subunit alcohol dehydrogenase family)